MLGALQAVNIIQQKKCVAPLHLTDGEMGVQWLAPPSSHSERGIVTWGSGGEGAPLRAHHWAVLPQALWEKSLFLRSP